VRRLPVRLLHDVPDRGTDGHQVLQQDWHDVSKAVGMVVSRKSIADSYSIWLDGRARQYPQLVPFSAGPAECPGRNVVLLTTSSLLAKLLATVDVGFDPRLSCRRTSRSR
jgi:hypothetical protein